MNTRARWFVALAFLCGVLLAAILPTSYWIIAPGNAVDLRSHVRVQGYPPPADRYFLTDVTLYRASVLLLPARYLPGVRLAPREEVIPSGIEPSTYDHLLVQDMTDSQDAAAIVAERAAGFSVRPPPMRVYVADILPDSRANGILHPGDVLLSIGGRPINAATDVAADIRRLAAGMPVTIRFRHRERVESQDVATMRTPTGVRLGVMVQARPGKAVLPVRVYCSLPDISGSSGGLMLALQIYRTLRPDHAGTPRMVAGTGTIAEDGSVGPVEGVEQKIIAAERAGLHVFLVPKENYHQLILGGHQSMRILPVSSFNEALIALETIDRSGTIKPAGLGH